MGIIDWFMPEEGYVYFYEPIFRKRLYVSARPYIMRKSQAEGEKDLERLVMKEGKEGCWAYLHDNSSWYSITAGHSKGKESLNVMSYDLDFSRMGSLFTHYHTHTKKGEECTMDAMVNNLKSQRSITKEQERRLRINCNTLLAVTISLPSFMDIYSYYNTAQRNQGCELEFKIANPHGITVIELLDKSLEPNIIAEGYKEVYEQTLYYGQMGAYVGMGKVDAIQSAFESVNVCFEGVIGLSWDAYKK